MKIKEAFQLIISMVELDQMYLIYVDIGAAGSSLALLPSQAPDFCAYFIIYTSRYHQNLRALKSRALWIEDDRNPSEVPNRLYLKTASSMPPVADYI